ncbi:MAG TPA: hypothetical protein VK939_04905 [Longimicrobiales bacterium]|nr:hypothetical protein [Longimicrobiales bacterium]
MLSLLGLPVAIALAWAFDLSRSGLRRTPPASDTPATAVDSPGATPPATSAGAIGRAAAGVAVVLLLLVAVAFATFRNGPQLRTDAGNHFASPPRSSVAQLTAEPGVEWFPGISPDGGWFVYSAEGAAGRDIFLRSVGGQTIINLTDDTPEDDDHPVFSPEGEHIAFWSARGGGGIFVMGRTGEAVRRVTRFGYKPTWSPDGRQLAFVTENVELNPQNMDQRSQLWTVDVASGALRQIESVDDAVVPSWSPHGQRIAYYRRAAGDSAAWGIWTVDSAGGVPVRVTRGANRDWNPVWAPDGEHLYFASDRAGSMNLWRIPIDEATGTVRGEPEPIMTPATSLAHISVSRDGRRVLYSSVLVTVNVQRLPVDPVTARPADEAAWVTSGTRRWSSPDPAPDGRRIAMYSLTQPEGHVYVINTDGSGLRQVTSDTAVDRVPRWSPDGEWIAFFSTRGGPLQLWMIRPDGSDLRQLTEAGTVAAWSPDGSRIATGTVAPYAYVIDPLRSWRQQTPDTLRLTDVAGDRFSPNDWSPDGAWLAGMDGFGDSGIIVHDIAGGRYERLTDFGQWPVWLPDSRTILFVSGGNAFYTVDRVSRVVRQVFAVRRDIIGPPRFGAHARSVYYTRRVTEADVWMVTFD